MNDTLVYEQYRSVSEINDAMIRVYNNMALAVSSQFYAC